MRVARNVLAISIVAGLLSGPAVYGDWPWSTKEPAKKPTAINKSEPQPSALSKMTTNTKNFFGNMFGAKKPEPKKPSSPYGVHAVPKKKEPKKESLLSSWFGPKETPPPSSTSDWMKLKPIRP